MLLRACTQGWTRCTNFSLKRDLSQISDLKRIEKVPLYDLIYTVLYGAWVEDRLLFPLPGASYKNTCQILTQDRIRISLSATRTALFAQRDSPAIALTFLDSLMPMLSNKLFTSTSSSISISKWTVTAQVVPRNLHNPNPMKPQNHPSHFWTVIVGSN